jgi:hypothetical protein
MPKYRKAIAKKQVCMDCVGMLKGYFWTNGGTNVREYIAGKVKTFENKYASNGMPDKSANGLLEWCRKQGCESGKIADLPDVPGVLLFSPGHVGIYIGGGKAVEARGFNYGVVETEVAKRSWKEWAYLPETIIEYDTIEVAPAPPHAEPSVDGRVLGTRMLRVGSKGSDGLKMQQMLNTAGYSCGDPDGDFGTNTEDGVKEFQAAHGLEVDGIYGPVSHNKLVELSDANKAHQKVHIRVTGGSVNIRTGPGTQHEVIRVVKKNTELVAVGKNAETGWWQLEGGGYISNKYTELV